MTIIQESEVETMVDEISLQVNITNEYAPRRYVMTGEAFDVMLEAVKALPQRSFNSVERVWTVRLAAISELKEKGFDVKRQSDFFVFPARDPDYSAISGTEMPVSIGVAIRNTSGTMPMLPQVYAHVLVIMSSECINQCIAMQTEQSKNVGIDINPTDTYIAYRVISKIVTEHYGERLRGAFKASYGKRTLDDIKSANRAVKDLIAADEGLDETGHVYPFTYEAVVVGGAPLVRPLEVSK